MRGTPIAAVSVASDQAGSACPPARRSLRRPHPRRWTRLDVANAIGIVFGLSCLAWLPAQAAVAAVAATPASSVEAAATPAPAALRVANVATGGGGQVDASSAADDLAAAGIGASDTAGTSETPAADATSRIVARSKPVSTTQGAATKPNTAAPDPSPQPAPLPAAAPATYIRDLYSASLFRYQDPDGTACTAAATEVMLNLTQGRGTAGDGFIWSATTSYQTQEAILAWERDNDTLDGGAPGSDPHGWRNALNYYGWGSFATFGARHYEDLSYSSYAAATKAAVIAIARENKPVGILAWAGGHAQIMTGYEVYGQDPTVSSDFSVTAVYLTDPLAGNSIVDARITYKSFQSGSTAYRFTAYGWKDSGADDPYMPGNTASWREWYGKWVIVAPVSFDSALPGSH